MSSRNQAVQRLRAEFAEDVALSDEPEVRQMLDKVAALAEALPLQPRTRRWRSLTYCIVDAVWSIGAHYDRVVVPLVRRVAQHHQPDGDPLTDTTAPLPPDPAPLPAFLSRFDEAALIVATNRQRTSTRNGTLKATAARAHAELFDGHGVRTLEDAGDLLLDAIRFDHLDDELRRLPGEGTAGVRRGYLWMLVGRDDLVKPDRMAVRALRHHGIDATALEAGVLLRAAAVRSHAAGRTFTAWELDHALWKEGRRLAVTGDPGAAMRTGRRSTTSSKPPSPASRRPPREWPRTAGPGAPA